MYRFMSLFNHIINCKAVKFGPIFLHISFNPYHFVHINMFVSYCANKHSHVNTNLGENIIISC